MQRFLLHLKSAYEQTDNSGALISCLIKKSSDLYAFLRNLKSLAANVFTIKQISKDVFNVSEELIDQETLQEVCAPFEESTPKQAMKIGRKTEKVPPQFHLEETSCATVMATYLPLFQLSQLKSRRIYDKSVEFAVGGYKWCFDNLRVDT